MVPFHDCLNATDAQVGAMVRGSSDCERGVEGFRDLEGGCGGISLH